MQGLDARTKDKEADEKRQMQLSGRKIQSTEKMKIAKSPTNLLKQAKKLKEASKFIRGIVSELKNEDVPSDIRSDIRHASHLCEVQANKLYDFVKDFWQVLTNA